MGGATGCPATSSRVPVRIGNAAHDQLQLDVFGEVMDTLHQGRRGGLSASEAGWDVQIALLDHLAKIWREPDHGIWEVRTAPMHFTYSKAMGWVAFDRALKSAEMFGLPGPTSNAGASCAREIHDDVCRNGWNAKRNSFTRSYGSSDLDASLLLLAPIGFLKPDDPRYRGTVEAIERELLVDGLVLRYDSLEIEGRPAARRRRVPRLQLLARRRLSAARPPRRCREAVPPADRALQRCRPACARNTTRAPGASSAIFRRPSRTSRCSTRRST